MKRLALFPVLLALAALACSSESMRARDLPIWECPTPTLLPTATMPPGWELMTPPPPFPTAQPLPTPYVKMTDFPLGRRVRLGSLGGIGLGLHVWMDDVEVDGPFLFEEEGVTVERYVASWQVAIHNGSWTKEYEFYPFAQVYALEVIDDEGEHRQSAWGLSEEASDLIGRDSPPLGVTLQPGQVYAFRAAALIPAPGFWRMGIVFDPLDTVDTDEMAERHSIGSNVGVWINDYDRICPYGDPPIPPLSFDGSIDPGIYIPGFLLTRHPVEAVSITRGFGCHPWFTGMRSSACPDDAPWFHNGVDYAISAGTRYIDPLPVSGVVDFAGADDAPDCSWIAGSEAPHEGYGYFVKHSSVVEGHSVTLWGGHLSGFNTTEGSATTPGQALGFIGSTGCSTGAHLHFAVSVDGVFVDPLLLIP